MVPHSTEGGNSLLLRAISSQNKNISFRRKSQINTGFAWSGFYLPKNCYFLTHFIRWMKDVSWELGKMSFMRAHTHPISLTLSQSQRNADFPLSVSLSFSLLHTHTHTQHSSTYTGHTHVSISSYLTKRLFLSRLPCISDIKGASSLTVDSGWACLTSPHCCVKFSHQWCVYLVW